MQAWQLPHLIASRDKVHRAYATLLPRKHCGGAYLGLEIGHRTFARAGNRQITLCRYPASLAVVY